MSGRYLAKCPVSSGKRQWFIEKNMEHTIDLIPTTSPRHHFPNLLQYYPTPNLLRRIVGWQHADLQGMHHVSQKPHR